jgi:hypothetical protein
MEQNRQLSPSGQEVEQMGKWEYDISVYGIEGLEEASSDVTPVIACDPEGVCFFKDTHRPDIGALISVLNERGENGWELVEMVSSPGGLVCIWKRRKSVGPAE